MENIHELDEEQVINIKNMLNSWDTNNIKLALNILNNANFKTKEVVNIINYLTTECDGLKFAVLQNVPDDNLRLRFHFQGGRATANGREELFIDDETTSETYEFKPFPYPDHKIIIR